MKISLFFIDKTKVNKALPQKKQIKKVVLISPGALLMLLTTPSLSPIFAAQGLLERSLSHSLGVLHDQLPNLLLTLREPHIASCLQLEF